MRESPQLRGKWGSLSVQNLYFTVQQQQLTLARSCKGIVSETETEGLSELR